MDRPSPPNRSASQDLRRRTTMRRMRPGTPDAGNGRKLQPPTVVSLPVRDGLRTIDLPLNEAYEGLESLAREDALSVVYEDEPSDSSTSELSVVFKGAHHSDRPAAPEVAPSSVRPPSHGALHGRSQVPGPVVASSGQWNPSAHTLPPPAPAPVMASSYHAPAGVNQDYPAPDYPAADYVSAQEYNASEDAQPANGYAGNYAPAQLITAQSAAAPTALPLPPPPSTYAGGFDEPYIPSAPPLPVGMVPPPPPSAYAAPASLPDFDDEVDTTVMPPRSVPGDSLQPVALRPHYGAPPRVVISEPRMRNRGALWLAGCGLAGGAALAAAALWWEGDRGELVIDVADQQCGAVEDVRIFVDEELACKTSPCTLTVKSGSHVVRAEAAGYAVAAPAAVLVDSEVPTLHKVQFGATTKTGIEVRSKVAGLNLYLDGKLVGQLPKRVTGLSTGEHTVLVTGGEGFYAEERKIELEADQLLVMDDIELKPRTGTLRIAASPQLEGASLFLDDQPITLPFTKQLDASKRHHVKAKRAGFEDFESVVEFDSANGEKQLNIQLVPRGAGGSEAAAESEERAGTAEAAASEPRAEGKRRGSRGRGAKDSNSEAGESARLNLLSDPPSMVLLDGKPIGQTPRMGVNVSAGTHAVLFIHPTMGRARASAKLDPGQSKTLRARF